MAPRKLSDSDKGDIIELYKQPNQTTSTLAEQYGVSNSTISRILKTTLPAEEYSALISQKRMAGADKTTAEKVAPARKLRKKNVPDKKKKRATADPIESVDTAMPELTEQNTPVVEATEEAIAQLDQAAKVEPPKLKTAAEKDDAPKSDTPKSRRRRRSRRSPAEDEQLPLLNDDLEDDLSSDLDDGFGDDLSDDLTADTPAEVASSKSSEDSDSRSKPIKKRSAPVLASSSDDDEDEDEDEEDDLLGLDETLGDDFGDDDDEDEDEDEDDEDSIDLPKPKLQSTVTLSVMPLAEAVLPKPCYLVVDMRSELITRPLSDFADLGQIPSDEEKAKTLPVFDNHRVARRFSRNKQRVIKVPDGDLITRTSPYLQAKGITRLLIDGQVFDLARRD